MTGCHNNTHNILPTCRADQKRRKKIDTFKMKISFEKKILFGFIINLLVVIASGWIFVSRLDKERIKKEIEKGIIQYLIDEFDYIPHDSGTIYKLLENELNVLKKIETEF